MKRVLTITLSSDWKTGLKTAGKRAQTGIAENLYQGETINFETPAIFFRQMTENRWIMVRALQQGGEAGVRELARRVERDVRRVHDDITILLELGLIEKKENILVCPYSDIHVDMHMKAA